MGGLPDLSKLPPALLKAWLSSLTPELRQEMERRIRMREQAAAAGGFLAELHPHQLAFIRDPRRRKVALCSRRAGKSFLILAWLIEGALQDPSGMSVYVARSKGDARRILGPAIAHYQQRWPQLGLELREVDGQLMLRVGCTSHAIWLAGARDKSAIDKFRGSAYKRVAIDEAQEYGAYLRELIVDVFEPCLLDKAGDLALCGTPSPVPAGLFYEASSGDGSVRWSRHHWTLHENPHVRNASQVLREFCETYGLDEGSATYRREWMGEWVRDEGALVYPFSAGINGVHESQLPEGLRYVLGVDIGFVDATAFVVVGMSPDVPHLWVVEAWKREGLIPSAVAAHVEQLIEKYGRALRVVVDEGGAGKGYAEEMRQRYGIGCEPAEKTKKRAYQEIVAGELRSGTIKIVSRPCHALLDEMACLQWGPGHESEDPRFENHCADALLYAVRASRNWYRSEREPPARGSPEWWAAETERQRNEIMDRVRRRTRGVGWSEAKRRALAR